MSKDPAEAGLIICVQFVTLIQKSQNGGSVCEMMREFKTCRSEKWHQQKQCGFFKIPSKTYLVSAESISSTASHAIRASGEVAPNSLEAFIAALMASEVSTRPTEFKAVPERAPKLVGAKALTEAIAKSPRDKESFMVRNKIDSYLKIF